MPEDQRCLRPLHYAKGCACRVLLSCCLKLNFTRSHRELQPTTSFQSTGATSLANILWLRARAPVLFLHHSLLTSHHPHLPNPPSPSASPSASPSGCINQQVDCGKNLVVAIMGQQGDDTPQVEHASPTWSCIASHTAPYALVGPR